MEQELKETPTKKKNKTRLIILASVLLIGGFFGTRAWLYAQHHESTDNAQLDATITSVRSAVSGFVKEVRFNDNQVVKKGDTLVIIDNKDYLARVMQAKAMLQSAEAQTGVSLANARAATQNASASTQNASAFQANINAATARLTKAGKEVDRVEIMFGQGAATQQQRESVRSEYQTARAQLQAAQRQYQASVTLSGSTQNNAMALKKQIGVSNALVEQRNAELQLAESQLQNTVIVAPFDGLVSKKSVESGQLVQIGQPVCSAVEIADLWVAANFKETQLGKIRVGQKVKVSLDAFKDLKLRGTVESIGGATGARFSLLPPDNATGNFVKVTQKVPVRIRLDKGDTKGFTLTPGLSAAVDIEIE